MDQDQDQDVTTAEVEPRADDYDEPIHVPEGDTLWMQDGLCSQVDPALFYPEFQGSKTCNTAKTVCARCDVREQCLAYAMQFPEADDWGVWGGTTAVERAEIRRARNATDNVIRLADLLPKPQNDDDYFITDVPDASNWDLDELEAEINQLAG